ncbi:hypothetical protein BU17DRAFT_60431 [Hysterangium stoloniferum]|nr:hypothetical protein BU17DRAFT_60430 [Hysterangium stoloniferum]KAF8529654.1 hypothetical protein BU17DRAFT_60431 [Hysterangium stoloniferum]
MTRDDSDSEIGREIDDEDGVNGNASVGKAILVGGRGRIKFEETRRLSSLFMDSSLAKAAHTPSPLFGDPQGSTSFAEDDPTAISRATSVGMGDHDDEDKHGDSNTHSGSDSESGSGSSSASEGREYERISHGSSQNYNDYFGKWWTFSTIFVILMERMKLSTVDNGWKRFPPRKRQRSRWKMCRQELATSTSMRASFAAGIAAMTPIHTLEAVLLGEITTCEAERRVSHRQRPKTTWVDVVIGEPASS